MVARALRQLSALALAVCGIGLTRCHVDDTLDDRLWPCDEAGNGEECGTSNGAPLTCWEGYCMPSCNPEQPPQDSSVECLAAGVLLEKCDPRADTCAHGLGCYRTDLLYDFGVCVPFPICSENRDCGDPKHNTCTTELLLERIGGERSYVSVNNLVCVGVDCSEGAQCADGERCLATAYGLRGNDLPDMCVRLCDGGRHCLPNFACAKTDVARGAEQICIPGVPGIRCMADQDCALGSCVPTGVGFSVCSIPCKEDDNCAILNAPPTYYRCIGATPEAQKYCINPSPFQGMQCDTAQDCEADTPACSHYSPFLEAPDFFECRALCDDERRCPKRGGLAHTCLLDGTCYPGVFSMPCNDSSECLTPFECREVVSFERDHVQSAKICTIACDEDSHCQPEPDRQPGDAWTLDRQKLGYCDGTWCRLPALGGKPCEKDEHCRSERCDGGLCTPP